MKHILLILFLLLSSLYAQKSEYSIIIDKPFNAALLDVTEDYDRTISAVGFSKEYKKSSSSARTFYDAFDYLAAHNSNSFGAQMQFVKTDNKAEIVLSKIAKLPKFNKAVALVKTPANGYFVGGYTLDGSLLVLKLDARANLLSSKLFGTKNYDRMNNLVLLSDGGVLAVGSSTTSRDTSDDMFRSGLGNNDIFLTRFSKNGHIVWSKKYGTMYDDRGIDAVEARDGSILVIGSTSYNKNRDVSIMRITENGNKIWLKHYKDKINGDNIVVPQKIIRLKDGNFVIALLQYNQMRKEHIRFVKFDLYQNILIDKEIFTTYPSGIKDIKEFSNGNFIAVGYVKDAYNTDALAMVLDSNLELLTQEHYGGENYDVFNAAKILHNSQVAVVGIHTSASSQETNMWIVKLEDNASIVQLPTTQSSLYQQLCDLFKIEIDKKQISITKDLDINFIDDALLFKAGAYILTQKQKLFLEKFSKKLIPFLHTHKKQIATIEINGHTSREWKNSSFAKGYLNNEKLSLNRSYETIAEIFNTQTTELQKWLTDVLKGSGYSYSKPIKQHNHEESIHSRRVNISIILMK